MINARMFLAILLTSLFTFNLSHAGDRLTEEELGDACEIMTEEYLEDVFGLTAVDEVAGNAYVGSEFNCMKEWYNPETKTSGYLSITAVEPTYDNLQNYIDMKEHQINSFNPLIREVEDIGDYATWNSSLRTLEFYHNGIIFTVNVVLMGDRYTMPQAREYALEVGEDLVDRY